MGGCNVHYSYYYFTDAVDPRTQVARAFDRRSQMQKNELGDECFDRSAEDILKIMAERNRQSSSGQPVAGGQRAPPQIVQSVDGKRRAVFYDDRTKWLPEEPAYQLQLDK